MEALLYCWYVEASPGDCSCKNSKRATATIPMCLKANCGGMRVLDDMMQSPSRFRAASAIDPATCPSARNRETHARLDSTIARAPTRHATCAAVENPSPLMDAASLLPARAEQRMSRTSLPRVHRRTRV